LLVGKPFAAGREPKPILAKIHGPDSTP
jgi:hypothetical protein